MKYLSENKSMVDKLKTREGLDRTPRQDTGRDRAWTIAHGHNLDANPLTFEIAEMLLYHTEVNLSQDGKITPGLIETRQTRNLFAQPITDVEAHNLLISDMDVIQDELIYEFSIMKEVFSEFEVRASGIFSMAFQMGIPRLRGFKNMWNTLGFAMANKNGLGDDWVDVAKEALDSQWARNHETRAKDVAYRLHRNEWPDKPL